MSAPDIFEILGVARREDIYSSVIVHAARASEWLQRHLLQVGFGDKAPELQAVDVSLRRRLDQAGVVDILLKGVDAEGRTWMLFIESKIDAAESRGQTRAYLDELRRGMNDPAHAQGIFLTLDGSLPSADEVCPHTHRDLATAMAETLDDYAPGSALRTAVEAYVARAQTPLPVADDDVSVGALLAEPDGLVPRHAGPHALGTVIAERAEGAWSAGVVWIQGRGHGNPGLLFRQPGWRGEECKTNRWSSANLDVHLEVQLVEGDPGPIKVHFETSPYMTKRRIDALANSEDFYAAREIFRTVLHERAADLDGWKMTRRRLQAAWCDPELDAAATVGAVVTAYAGEMRKIGAAVDAALKEALKRGVI